MNQNDYYIWAVTAWQNGDKQYKRFAECCYYVADRETQALAADCKCSVDTIERYRNAYTLFLELGGAENPTCAEVWEQANISLWVKAASLRRKLNITSAQIFDYLRTASENGMTREQMAANVEEIESHIPQWVRRITGVIKSLNKSLTDYKSDLTPEQQEKYQAAVTRFMADLEELMAESESA